MTTKAFTSSLGDGITVKGYIDEDDRLVLLEPEGGGGELRTATVGISNGTEHLVYLPIIDSNGRVGSTTLIDDVDEFTVPMSESGGVVSVEQFESVSITLTGDIAVDASHGGSLLVTGDGTINITEK